MTARTGDVIETREQLEALPTGSWIGIVRHEEFRTYEKWDDDEWLTERGVVFDPDHLPARVLHVPGEHAAHARPLPTRDEIARAIYDALSGQYGDFNMPHDAADAVLKMLEGDKR